MFTITISFFLFSFNDICGDRRIDSAVRNYYFLMSTDRIKTCLLFLGLNWMNPGTVLEFLLLALYKHALKLLSGEKIMRICTAIKESQHFTMLKTVHHQHQKVLICWQSYTWSIQPAALLTLLSGEVKGALGYVSLYTESSGNIETTTMQGNGLNRKAWARSSLGSTCDFPRLMWMN